MNPLARLRSRLKWMAKPEQLESEMETEARFHIESHAADLVKRGVSEAAAMRRARIEFGGIESNKDAIPVSLGLRFWDELLADVRYGARMLRRSPGFTCVAIASLALGIGANTAIFSGTKKVLLDTLPVKNPHELRMLTWVSGHEQLIPPLWGDVYSIEGGGLMSTAFSYPVFEELRRQKEVFQDLIAFKDTDGMTATVDGHSQLIAAEMVSVNAFTALGVEPKLGRLLSPADDAGPGSGPVTVISEPYWAERFDRSPSALGKTLFLNGVPVTVVGVLPERFTGLKMGVRTQIFVPLTMQPLLMPRAQLTASGNGSLLNNAQSWWLVIIVRLLPNVSETRAQAALDVTLRQATVATFPTARVLGQFHPKLQSGGRGLDYLREFARPSYVLLALAGLVLALACVNLANLLQARASIRQREISTRIVLGAGKVRILRQLLTESLLLSGLGGAAGLVLGYLARNAIPRLFETPGNRNIIQPDFDWQVLAFTIGISLLTAIVFGGIPAWQAIRGDVNTSLKGASQATLSQQKIWLGKGLVTLQIALSTVLLK